MGVEAETIFRPRLLFTAPWEPVVVRRGDALGLRALADQFADALAPGLSNRVRDGRWVTILAWCLARSHEVFHALGKRSVATRAQHGERYAWLRPLELMWVARTIALADDWRARSLAGQRRVKPWYEHDQSMDHFGMSPDQFRAYRQTGMYGGYRIVFRKWPGMTSQGDGWTPGVATINLANWLDRRLFEARPAWPLHAAGDEGDWGSQRIRSRQGEEHRWWLRKWPGFDAAGGTDGDTLPRRRDDFGALPEGDLLKPLVFGSDPSGTWRLAVAREAGKSMAASHLELCEHLGRAFASNHIIPMLPSFSRLADAGMAAMDLIARSLLTGSRVRLADVAALPGSAIICSELMAAAQAWRGSVSLQVRHAETAHRFAVAIPSARPQECLRALLRHHEAYGGGLRWFVLRDGWIEPRTPARGGTSRYRFRLWSLCRLAAQCAVLRDMPRALLEDDGAEDEERTEATNE